MSERGTRIAGSASADVLAWDDGRVLKLYRPGYPAGAAAREAAHARAAHAAGVPTPAVLDVVAVDGRMGVVFERVDAPTMLARLIADSRMAETLAATMAAVHADMHGRAAASLPWQHSRLADKIGRAGGLTPQARGEALRALASLPRGQSICHGDLHPGNIVMTDAGPAVIDWLDATLGDPVADVTRTILLFEHAAAGPLEHRAGTDRLRADFLAAYLRAYAERRPLPAERVQAWRLPVAAARLSEPLGAAEREALVDAVMTALARR